MGASWRGWSTKYGSLIKNKIYMFTIVLNTIQPEISFQLKIWLSGEIKRAAINETLI